MYREFVFGPVPSRRLGLSLGVNLIPYKVCTFNCVYCELGKTTELTVERRPYYNADDIESSFTEYIKRVKKIDYVTFSGSGEPTLNTELSKVIGFVKEHYNYRIAVLTNGSLMFRKDVREDLALADVVIPSLDTVKENTFKKLNMPHNSLTVGSMIDGIARFAEDFAGDVWLEVLFVNGFNDSDEELASLIDALKIIKPTKVQIGTVDRPPSYKTAKRVRQDRMMEIFTVLSTNLPNISVEMIGSFSGDGENFGGDLENSILKLINVRPCSKEELSVVFGVEPEIMHSILDKLMNNNKIEIGGFSGKEFVVPKRQ